MRKICGIVLAFLFFAGNALALEVGDIVPKNTLKTLSYEKDKILIVDFFASWCPSCKKELPLVNDLSNRKNTKFKIVGVDTDEDINEGIAFQKSLKLDFFVVNDNEHKIVKEFLPIGMPALYYIKNEKVVKIIFGAVDHIDNVIENDIRGM